MKKTVTKATLSRIATVALLLLFAVFAAGSTTSTTESLDQGSGVANSATESKTEDTTNNILGKYQVDIKSCRLAKSFDDKDVVIVKYGFTNVSDDSPASFNVALTTSVFQNGIGLNEAYILRDDAGFSLDNQSKELRKGASLDVEVAYELNDTTTDIEIEVSRFFSFSNTKITKTFKIA